MKQIIEESKNLCVNQCDISSIIKNLMETHFAALRKNSSSNFQHYGRKCDTGGDGLVFSNYCIDNIEKRKGGVAECDVILLPMLKSPNNTEYFATFFIFLSQSLCKSSADTQN